MAYESRRVYSNRSMTCPYASAHWLLDSLPGRRICFCPAAEGTLPGYDMDHETRAWDAWDKMHVRLIRARTESDRLLDSRIKDHASPTGRPHGLNGHQKQ